MGIDDWMAAQHLAPTAHPSCYWPVGHGAARCLCEPRFGGADCGGCSRGWGGADCGRPRTREVRRSFLSLDYDDAVRWARTIGGALTSMEAPLAFAAENELELVHEMSRTFHSSNWLNHFHILYFEDVWLEAMRYDGRRLGHRAPARH